ncbi:MAG: hypothetical protein IT304_12715, partial [Dehalococcoidia bacterium]|nr:hypothetical protein [Dehalococcoidia bacterium]
EIRGRVHLTAGSDPSSLSGVSLLVYGRRVPIDRRGRYRATITGRGVATIEVRGGTAVTADDREPEDVAIAARRRNVRDLYVDTTDCSGP